MLRHAAAQISRCHVDMSAAYRRGRVFPNGDIHDATDVSQAARQFGMVGQPVEESRHHLRTPNTDGHSPNVRFGVTMNEAHP